MGHTVTNRLPAGARSWIDRVVQRRAGLAFVAGAVIAGASLPLPVDYMASVWELGTEWIYLGLGWHNFAAGIALWGALVLPMLGLALRFAGQHRSAIAAGVLAWLSALAIAPFLSFGANGPSGLRLGIVVLLAGNTAMLAAFVFWLRAAVAAPARTA